MLYLDEDEQVDVLVPNLVVGAVEVCMSMNVIGFWLSII